MSKSLFFRFFLIIVLPILILQLVGLYVFYERHWDTVSRRLESTLINEVATIYSVFQAKGEKEAKIVASLLGFSTTIQEANKSSYIAVHNSYFDALAQQTQNVAFKPVFVSYSPDRNDIVVSILHSPQQVYQLQFSYKKLQSPTVAIFFIWMIGSAFLVMCISVVFMRNQVRAIRQLAEVAEKFGKGQEADKFKPSGAREVRAVGKAFLRMKARIKRQIYYRTQLLAHISHDLRTPLTRMLLSTELMQQEEVVRDFKTEIKLMEHIIDDYLNFAKEEGNEQTKSFDAIHKLKDIIQRYDNKHIAFSSKLPSFHIKFRPYAFERAINNLIDNALRYYRSEIRIEFSMTETYWYLYIEDDGVGIAPSHYKKVFQPFYKVDRASAGFGLGLASVKSIIYSHGGKIKLSKSALGGLRVIVRVPL